MSNIIMQCPVCSAPFQVSPESEGEIVGCPGCSKQVVIPKSTKNRKSRETNTNPNDGPPTETSVQPSACHCPHCNGQFGVSPGMLGTQVTCPHCQKTVEIDPKGQAVAVSPEDSADDPELFAPGHTPNKKKSRKPKSRTPASSGSEKPLPTTPSNVSANSSNAEPELGSKPSPTDEPAVNDMGIPTFRTAPADATDAPSPAEYAPTAEDAQDLLPAQFRAADPSRMSSAERRRSNKVLLPNAAGGTQHVDQSTVTIDYKGERVELQARSHDDRQRYRRRVNIISLLIGLAFIAIAVAILLN